MSVHFVRRGMCTWVPVCVCLSIHSYTTPQIAEPQSMCVPVDSPIGNHMYSIVSRSSPVPSLSSTSTVTVLYIVTTSVPPHGAMRVARRASPETGDLASPRMLGGAAPERRGTGDADADWLDTRRRPSGGWPSPKAAGARIAR